MISKTMFQPRWLENTETLTLVVLPDEPMGTLQPYISSVLQSIIEALFIFQGSLFLHTEWKRKLLSRVLLFANPWIIQPMEFSGPEY